METDGPLELLVWPALLNQGAPEAAGCPVSKTKVDWTWQLTPSILALGGQRQADLCEFEATWST